VWNSPNNVRQLQGHQRGVGGAYWTDVGDRGEIAGSYGVINVQRAKGLQPGFGPNSHGALLLHELLHTLGLRHQQRRDSIMHPYLNKGAGELGRIDRTNLRRLYPPELLRSCER
jgi:hypothetical protein